MPVLLRHIADLFKGEVIGRLHAAQAWVASYAPDLFCSVAGARFEGIALAPPRVAENAYVRADADFPPFVVTTANGVYFCSTGGVFRWLDGSYYGLAWDCDRLFILQRGTTRKGRKRLRTLLPDPDLLLRVETAPTESVPRLFPELAVSKRLDSHSLDMFGGQVYLTLTAQNSILVYDPTRRTTVISRIGPRSYKNGTRYLDRYHHLNSLFVDKDWVWLMAHNDTSYTSRKSEILRVPRAALDDGQREISPDETIRTRGSHAHNLFRVGSDLYWCDSYGNSANRNDEVIASLGDPYFTRGLDWDGAYLVVGGSQLEKKREARGQRSGLVGIWRYVGSGKAERTGTLMIERSGHVCDVRFLNGSLGLSKGRTGSPDWLQTLVVAHNASPA